MLARTYSNGTSHLQRGTAPWVHMPVPQLNTPTPRHTPTKHVPVFTKDTCKNVHIIFLSIPKLETTQAHRGMFKQSTTWNESEHTTTARNGTDASQRHSADRKEADVSTHRMCPSNQVQNQAKLIHVPEGGTAVTLGQVQGRLERAQGGFSASGKAPCLTEVLGTQKTTYT